MKCALFSALLLVFALGCHAQTATDSNEGSRLTVDSTHLNTYDFSWYGHSGRTYFIQHTDDLTSSWNYLPVIESGTNGVLTYSFYSTAPRTFLRLRYSTATTSNPRFDDFDSDKVPNFDELQADLDPFSSVDSDSDGMADDYEMAYFGTLSRNGTGDFDGDGVSDADEYSAGRHPNSAIQYGTLKFTYAGDGPTNTVVYFKDEDDENSLKVTYTDATHTRVSSILVHLDTKWYAISSYAPSEAPTMATYSVTTNTDGAHTLTFTSNDLTHNERHYVGMDLLRKIDGMPYAKAVVSGTVRRVAKYTAITSSSVATICPTVFPSIIRDFPYKKTEYPDFGRGNNNDGDMSSFVQSTLGVNGLPLSTLTDTNDSRKIYSAESFSKWYTKPDTLSLNLDATEPLDSGWYGFRNIQKFPFTVETSSAGGYFNQFCWTTEVHTKLTYDVDPESSNPTKVRVDSDDDIFVFLNGKLIISRAGIPGGYQEVTLRDIEHGLSGNTGIADLAIFHAERREFSAALHVQSSTAMTPVYVYQVIADTRFPSLTPQFSLADGHPFGMSIDSSTGKILWDYSSGTLGTTYTFTVNVSDGKQNTDSQTVNLTLGTKPTFTTQPSSQWILLGDGFTLSAAATGIPAPTYQWFKNDTPIDGATSATYTVTSASLDDDANYTVKATNAIGTASASAYIFVYE